MSLRPLFPQVHWTSFYCEIAKVMYGVVVKGQSHLLVNKGKQQYLIEIVAEVAVYL